MHRLHERALHVRAGRRGHHPWHHGLRHGRGTAKSFSSARGERGGGRTSERGARRRGRKKGTHLAGVPVGRVCVDVSARGGLRGRVLLVRRRRGHGRDGPGRRHVRRVLLGRHLHGHEHLRVALALVRPYGVCAAHAGECGRAGRELASERGGARARAREGDARTDSRRVRDLIILERVKIVLDVHGLLLERARAEERVRRRRRVCGLQRPSPRTRRSDMSAPGQRVKGANAEHADARCPTCPWATRSPPSTGSPHWATTANRARKKQTNTTTVISTSERAHERAEDHSRA